MKYYNVEMAECIDAGIDTIYCGREECKSGHSFGPHIRDYYLLHYIESGCGTFEIDGKEYKLSAGDVFFIMPKVETYYEADKETPWKYMWVGFRGRNIGRLFKMAGLSRENPTASVDGDVKKCIQEIIKTSKTPDRSISLVSRSHDFFHSLIQCRGIDEKRRTNAEVYVDSAIDYIKHYVYKNITVVEIAEYLNIDRSYLTSLFKKHHGMSPKQYILNVKMRTACDFLSDTEYDVTKIAQSVGYDDLYVFSHAFKKVIGVSPTVYRRQKST